MCGIKTKNIINIINAHKTKKKYHPPYGYQISDQYHILLCVDCRPDT